MASIFKSQQGSIVRDIVGSQIGNYLTFFDFLIYGFMSAYIAEVIFHGGPAAVVSTFLVFGVGFLFRPLGSIVFAHIGDRSGRRKALIISFLFMGVGTLFTGLVPSYAAIGLAAPLLLALFRIFQGFGAGGDYGGAAIYLTEIARDDSRALVTNFQQIAVQFGVLTGSLLAYGMSLLGNTFMLDVGWRLPFIVGGIILTPLGYFLRRGIDETKEFELIQQKKEVLKSPWADVFKPSKGLKLSMLWAGGTAVLVAGAYLTSGYLSDYLDSETKVSLTQAFLIISIATAFFIVIITIFAYISDKIKRRKPLPLMGAILLTVLAYPIFYAMHGQGFVTVLLMVLLLNIFVALINGNFNVWLGETYGTNVRYSAFIPYAIVVSLVGGFAPYVSSDLILAFNNPYAPAYYLIVAGIFTIIAYILIPDTGKMTKLTDEGYSITQDGSTAMK